ncbi:hypothetical protein JOC24_006686 [Streptomyces sp. HB132]|nr:hypothetical protein [Streptomyces sp. HB132]
MGPPGSRLCAAIVDRFTFGGNIIETGTDSYRLATTRARAEQQAARWAKAGQLSSTVVEAPEDTSDPLIHPGPEV